MGRGPLDRLRNLEYRGYDFSRARPGTARAALPGGIETPKGVGLLDNLAGAVGRRNGDFFKVRAGIGHNQWTTHGRRSEDNAHPYALFPMALEGALKLKEISYLPAGGYPVGESGFTPAGRTQTS